MVKKLDQKAVNNILMNIKIYEVIVILNDIVYKMMNYWLVPAND